jgi:hypothetical protein
MKEAFIVKKFTPESQELLTIVDQVLEEYRRQGFRLSLRQLYYQLVARDLLPERWRDRTTGSKNCFRSYKNLGSLVSDGRQAGLLDWSLIEDRGRELEIPSHWDNPAEIITAAARGFRINKWDNQPWHVLVMVEKDALSGVLEPVCRRLDIGLMANKGYSSSSTMYEIGKQLQSLRVYSGKSIRVLYLGDHDPSGIDMTRDIEDRLELFSGIRLEEDEFEVVRIALNYDQVQQWNPPENPAKETDVRYAAYVDQFGESSWELDAIEPRILADLVEEAVLERRDEDLWDEAVETENGMRQELEGYATQYRKDHPDQT